MDCIRLTAAVAAIAAAGWAMPARSAEPAAKAVQGAPAPTTVTSTTPTPSTTAAPSTILSSSPVNTSQSTLAPPRGLPLRRVNPAASAASGAHDDADVRTTSEDGRTVTRNAHDRNETSAASSPQ